MKHDQAPQTWTGWRIARAVVLGSLWTAASVAASIHWPAMDTVAKALDLVLLALGLVGGVLVLASRRKR